MKAFPPRPVVDALALHPGQAVHLGHSCILLDIAGLRVLLDPATAGGGPAVPPTVAPDGTLYGLGVSAFGEYRFFAASTGVTPGPFLWPHSGYNWARTNSVLPD